MFECFSPEHEHVLLLRETSTLAGKNATIYTKSDAGLLHCVFECFSPESETFEAHL